MTSAGPVETSPSMFAWPKTLKTHLSFHFYEGVRMAKFLTLDDVEVKDKVVLVRVDFNSPICESPFGVRSGSRRPDNIPWILSVDSACLNTNSLQIIVFPPNNL